jgi:orotidine-5'-phosphate decarboxylase
MDPRIIIALDVESATEARTLINTLGEDAGFYKVGLELYAAAGMDFVRELVAHGKQVFLDLKLYDIGETVKRAVAQIARVPGIRLLTVHAMKPVMLAAVAGRGESPLRLLGVTVLTSFDENDLREMGYRTSVKDLVELRVRHAIEAGMDGVVCSPLEVAAVRAAMGPKAVLVTPGVRSAGAAAGDQKRVASPTDALRSGASHLVIGRQVTRAADPRAELRRMLAEIAAV